MCSSSYSYFHSRIHSHAPTVQLLASTMHSEQQSEQHAAIVRHSRQANSTVPSASQVQLMGLSKKIRRYNDEASARPFPYNFTLHHKMPSKLDTVQTMLNTTERSSKTNTVFAHTKSKTLPLGPTKGKSSGLNS